MNTSKTLSKISVFLGGLLMASLLVAEPLRAITPKTVNSIPFQVENSKELQQIMQQSNSSLYAINAVDENGYATGKTDPVLLRLVMEPVAPNQALTEMSVLSANEMALLK